LFVPFTLAIVSPSFELWYLITPLF
jgi:hypothetical protein